MIDLKLKEKLQGFTLNFYQQWAEKNREGLSSKYQCVMHLIDDFSPSLGGIMSLFPEEIGIGALEMLIYLDDLCYSEPDKKASEKEEWLETVLTLMDEAYCLEQYAAYIKDASKFFQEARDYVDKYACNLRPFLGATAKMRGVAHVCGFLLAIKLISDLEGRPDVKFIIAEIKGRPDCAGLN